MPFTVIALILVSVVLMGVQPNWRRFLIKERKFSDFEVLTAQCGVGAVCCCLLPYLACPQCWARVEVHNDPWMFWVAVAGTTLANIIIQWAGMRAARLAQVSFFGPIAAMTPGLVTITSSILGEFPGKLGWIGIVVVAAATYIHSRESKGFKEYLEPFFFWKALRAGSLPEAERLRYAALACAYTGALFSTVGLTFDGILPRYGNPALGVTVETLSLGIVYAASVAFERKPGLANRIRKNWRHLLGIGVVWGLPFILLTGAFAQSPIAYVSAMKRLSIFVATLVAIYGFGELSSSEQSWTRKRRIITGGVIAVGAVMVAADDKSAVVIASADQLLRAHASALAVVAVVFAILAAVFGRFVLPLTKE